MAVSLLNNIHYYQCLSSDSKPTTGVNIGSRLFETDTGASFIFNGSTWIKNTSAAVDNSTYARTIIDYVHHEIHGGSGFYVMYSVASLGAMTTPDDMITLDWTTPNTAKWGHFVFSVSGSADWRVRLIEAPSGGAASPTGQLAILNHNRNSAVASTFTDGSVAAQVNYDSTLATGGIALWDQYLEGSGGPQAGGSGSAKRNEIVLKQNTKYQLSLFGTDTNPATMLIDWYEHTDKE